jgi:hypothetical protein
VGVDAAAAGEAVEVDEEGAGAALGGVAGAGGALLEAELVGFAGAGDEHGEGLDGLGLDALEVGDLVRGERQAEDESLDVAARDADTIVDTALDALAGGAGRIMGRFR